MQQECGCIIGNTPQCGYPSPVVDHDIASQQNMGKMKQAYANHSGGDGAIDDVDGDSGSRYDHTSIVINKMMIQISKTKLSVLSQSKTIQIFSSTHLPFFFRLNKKRFSY